MKILQQHAVRFLATARKFHLSASNKCSALYVTSVRAQETYGVLQPNLDAESKFRNLEELKNVIAVRGMENVNVEKLKESWDFLESVKAIKRNIELKREATTKELKELFKDEKKNEKEIKPLKAVSVMLRDNLKSMTQEIAALEDNVILKLLQLPNDLHPKTPPEKNKIFYEVDNSTSMQPHKDLIRFQKNAVEDVTSAKAHLELSLSQICYKTMGGYVKSANSDFVKSVIAEGCGLAHRDASSVLILLSDEDTSPDASVHLVGGASRASFCALFAKTLNAYETLPIKLVTVGRQYYPDRELASPVQTTAAEVFAVLENCREKEYDVYMDMLEDVKCLYNSLSVPYRLVSLSGRELKNWESLSTAIEIFSVRKNEFVQVGFLSLCGPYISRRLLMKYKQKKSSDFLNVITGTVMDFNKVESCLL
ncbi:serine--tRNA synthetase-like protein Slimp [Cloeon dipterum]|uniref:serine--tRNA synthetase-like protein Slimp n=1 Tax=Cloeon dipterum TaxID=197152 RepID=UPI00321F674D